MFSEKFLNESPETNTAPGIYFALLLSNESKEKLLSFCEKDLKLDMNNAHSPYENRTHSTLFSSLSSEGKSLEHFAQFMEQKTFTAKGFKWEIIIGQNTQKKCLILKLESSELVAFHHELSKKIGLFHSFDEYIPHISIHYDYQGDIPNTIPDFEINLAEMYSKPYFFKAPVVANQNRRINNIISNIRNRRQENDANKIITFKE